jgi:hypothetical protein
LAYLPRAGIEAKELAGEVIEKDQAFGVIAVIVDFLCV